MRNLATPVLLALATLAHAGPPNIVFILSDDVGYGDLVCYGATKVKTPSLDRLAREGTRFTDAHSTGSVCTPTRFAFMSGRYAWRQAGTGIAPGNATLLIKPGTPTVETWRGMDYQTVLTPAELKTGDLIYPFEKAK